MLGRLPPLFLTLHPLRHSLYFLLFCIGVIKPQWIMPILLLGKNKTIGFSDKVEVCILFSKNEFFYIKFSEKNLMQSSLFFVFYVKFIS